MTSLVIALKVQGGFFWNGVMEHYINDSNEEAISAKGERKGFGPNTMFFFSISQNKPTYFANF